MAAVQRTLDDLGVPLSEVTFVVLDLETTGGSPTTSAITEVGGAKFRGGELLGTFQTLVNPGLPIPPEITYLTGITEAMVVPAPPVERVLGPLRGFVGNGVIVGHNVRFDLGFLRAAMSRHGWAPFSNVAVDTCRLARRLIRDEVPNCKLSTLAAHFRTAHEPTHRALDDALATAEVLHALLERAGAIGVLGLDDLVALPTVGGHPQLAKLKLATRLPRRPGVYLFRDGAGRVLYVGKATNLRRRVRSYFSSDDRRKIGPLLRETATVDHVVCSGELEASVLEVRLIHQLAPRYNRRLKEWRRYAYLKLTLSERFPRLSVVRACRADGDLYLGPLPSAANARLVADAIHTALPLRRCTARPGRTACGAPCTPAQLGVATCPCSGAIDVAAYAAIVERAVQGLRHDPTVLLGPLRDRMTALAAQGRFEEAADVRDRAAALSRALERQRRLDALRAAGEMRVHVPGEGSALVRGGLLAGAWGDDDDAEQGGATLPLTAPPCGASPPAAGAAGDPVPLEAVDELAAVAGWLDARAGRVQVLHCDRGLAWPLPRVASFAVARG